MPTPTPLTVRFAAARDQLAPIGQDHVLRYFDQLDAHGKEKLLTQIEGIDWPEIARLIESHVKHKPTFEMPENVQPAPWYPYEPTDKLADKYAQAKARGEALLREGKVAAFTVAGGQGTRLGWDGPKGTFPATPIRGLSLLGCFAEYLLKLQAKFAKPVPWYLMTSPINDADTRAFLRRHSHFGLDREQIMIFPQAMMPAIDPVTRKVFLADRDSLALSPNGHGGSLKALHTAGALADMRERGIEQISYFQVDNPTVHVVDPLFIGLHALDHAQMSSKMLPKIQPKEKLGNFCLVDGKMTVIEYSDLPDELATQRDERGQLRFRAGSIALHALRVDFVEKLNAGDPGNTSAGGGFGLPFHRADKKVAYLDADTQQRVEPDQANAVKLETFVFDALPMCERSIVYETDRVEEFAPIKNSDAPGCTDCPASSKALQVERAARWLEQRGVKVGRDARGVPTANIEIKAATAIEPDDLPADRLPAEVSDGDMLL